MTSATTWVYDFSEGGRDQKDLLGGKGANLAEMTNLGLPVPPGFTITTDACRYYLEHGGTPELGEPGRDGDERLVPVTWDDGTTSTFTVIGQDGLRVCGID